MKVTIITSAIYIYLYSNPLLIVLITDAQLENGESIGDILPESPKRVRRQSQSLGGGKPVLPIGGSQAHHMDFSVTQDCYGVTINWIKYNLPYRYEIWYISNIYEPFYTI